MSLGQKVYNFIENIMRTIVTWFENKTNKQLPEEKFQVLMQFIRFGIVGVSNTLISYLIYTGGLIALRRVELFPRWDYVLAQVMSFILSVLWSFYWNNKKVFVKQENEERSTIKALLKTYVSYSFTGLFLSSMLLVLWIEYLGMSEFIAPLLNLIITVPLNFIINKFWAFKTKKK